MSHAEELYWDIDSDVLPESATPLPESSPRPAPQPGGSPQDASAPMEAEPHSLTGSAAWDRSRSLRKPRAEPLPFHAADSPKAAARIAESAPLSPIELAPRTPRTDPMETLREENAASPSKMPLQRKSGEGVEIFTRMTTRPQSAADSALPFPPMAEPLGTGGSGVGFGKLKENSVPTYQSSRLQEVIDHTYSQTSHRRRGRRRGLKGRVGKVFFTVAFAGLGGILIWVWTRPQPELLPFPAPEQPPAGTSSSSAGTPASPAKSSLPDPGTLPPLPERHAAIRDGLTALLQAPGWEAKLPWVLHAERLSGRMKDFYLAQQGQDPQITGIGISQPVAGPDAWWFLLSLDNPDGPPIRIAARETPEGPRFDWENLVAYGSMPYTLFRSEKPGIPQSFRLGIRSSSTFAGKYTESEYAACEVAPRSGEPILRAYARLGTPAADQIAALTSKPGWNAALLSLHWEADAGSADAVAVEQANRISLPGEEAEKEGPSFSNEKPGSAVQSGARSVVSGASSK